MRAKINSRNVATFKPTAKPYEVTDSDLPGFTLRIEPSGARRYFVRYRMPDGQRGRYRIGDAAHMTPVQARDEAKKKRLLSRCAALAKAWRGVQA